jgi:hypothetical protein
MFSCNEYRFTLLVEGELSLNRDCIAFLLRISLGGGCGSQARRLVTRFIYRFAFGISFEVLSGVREIDGVQNSLYVSSQASKGKRRTDGNTWPGPGLMSYRGATMSHFHPTSKLLRLTFDSSERKGENSIWN